MTENLPEAEIRSGRKGETGREKGRRGGKGREVGIEIRREAGIRTEIGREAKTGSGTESVMVRRKGTATTEIGIGIVVNEGKGQGIEMKTISTEAVILTGKIVWDLTVLYSELVLQDFHQHLIFSSMQCITLYLNSCSATFF